ncbi:MAG: universal stress protein [Candidatus Rokubacteria bacterium]|nr:universal stress protein [Candidatus Rokubacteria bacterium]
MVEILVAVDFSPCSERALEVARDYAGRLGARLHILHVVWPGIDPGPDARLERLAADSQASIPVVPAVASGVPAVQIVRYARRHPIDLIVVGTHGRTGLSRVLLGSVAERVVRTAPCPVLTVPPADTIGRAEAVPAPEPGRCVACAQPSEDLICDLCRARIRGEALERKQREERPGRVAPGR